VYEIRHASIKQCQLKDPVIFEGYIFNLVAGLTKLFFFVSGEGTKKAAVFVPGNPFHPGLGPTLRLKVPTLHSGPNNPFSLG
jgi:hypothetical protein